MTKQEIAKRIDKLNWMGIQIDNQNEGEDMG